MSFLDKFKKEKDEKNQKPADVAVKDASKKKKVHEGDVVEEKKSAAKKPTTKKADVEAKKSDEPKKSSKSVVTSDDDSSVYAHRVLLQPVVSEKSALLASKNQYVFKIHPNANKVMVKKAIKEVYKVEPTGIRVINMGGSKVTRGRITGKTASYKKAIVQMPKGVELPIYEGV